MGKKKDEASQALVSFGFGDSEACRGWRYVTLCLANLLLYCVCCVLISQVG